MQFKLSTVVLASLLAAVPALAAPTADVAASALVVPEPEEGLTLSRQYEIPNGIISYYDTTPGFETTKRAVGPLASQKNKRCGSDSAICSNTYQATVAACYFLSDMVGGSSAVIGESTRSICSTLNNYGTCCISWASNAAFLESDLIYGAEAALEACDGNPTSGYISSIVRDVFLNGVCLNQCMSNRAGGCPA
jgi:hypothetical protein